MSLDNNANAFVLDYCCSSQWPAIKCIRLWVTKQVNFQIIRDRISEWVTFPAQFDRVTNKKMKIAVITQYSIYPKLRV